MCEIPYASCRTKTFYIWKLQRLLIFHHFVCKAKDSSTTILSSSTGSPVDSSHILSHKSHKTYLIDLDLKENKIICKMTPTFLQFVIRFYSKTALNAKKMFLCYRSALILHICDLCFEWIY